MTQADQDRSGGDSPELLATKLRPPVPSGPVVGAERLHALLDEATAHRVTLVIGPAGYGKTTRLAGWCTRPDRTVGGRTAWLSLGPLENDPATFLRYLVGALGTVFPDAVVRAQTLLTVPGADPDQAVARLVNDLAAATSAPVWLALDDLHLITDERCHALLAELIAQAPAGLRFVLSSRSDPVLALGSLRAAGALAEIREAELQFTAAEVTEYLRAAGLELSAEQVDLLRARTEGWPAALQLAAIWLRRSDDPARALRQFAGDHQHVVDYLGEQVLGELDAETEAFLLETSILHRFTAPLCDAVTGRADAEEQLARLLAENLFVVALDARRRWFRYHHLFAGVLRAELRRRRPDDVGDLHRRAFAWHAAHGSPGDAVRHAVLAGDAQGAARVITVNWVPMFRSGRSSTVRQWIAMLSPEQAVDHPELAYIAGVTLGVEGGAEEEIAVWMRSAETAVEERTAPAGPLPDGTVSYTVNLDVLRSAFVYRDVGEALAAARRVVAAERPGGVWGPPGHAMVAFLAYLVGEHELADASIVRVVSDPDAPRRPHAFIQALATRALREHDDGDDQAARRSARQALDYADALGLGKATTTALARVALGRSLPGEQGLGALEAAAHQLTGRAPRTAPIYALLCLAAARQQTGDLVGSHEAADQAALLLEPFREAGILTTMLDEVRSRATAGRRPRRPAAPGSPLTETELAVLRALAAGGTRREVAAALSLAPDTVKSHTSRIYRKLGVSSRDAALAAAAERHLL